MIKKMTNQILKKITKEELAARADVSVTTIIRWSTETPKTQNKGTVLLLQKIMEEL